VDMKRGNDGRGRERWMGKEGMMAGGGKGMACLEYFWPRQFLQISMTVQNYLQSAELWNKEKFSLKTQPAIQF
jgi:hypothetical protein